MEVASRVFVVGEEGVFEDVLGNLFTADVDVVASILNLEGNGETDHTELNIYRCHELN